MPNAVQTTWPAQPAKMRYHLVGIDMRSTTHDYEKMHCALMLIRARKVSKRVWICGMDAKSDEYILSLLRLCLANDDKMIVSEMPSAFLSTERALAA